MKKTKYIIFMIFLVGCQFDNKETNVILFNPEIENIQTLNYLNNSLKDLDYTYYLEKYFPDFKDDIKGSINYNFVLDERKKEIKFTLEIQENPKINKQKISNLFIKIINAQIEFHVEYKSKVDSSIYFAETNLKYLDKNDIEVFMNNTTDSMKNSVVKAEFYKSNSIRNEHLNEKRIFRSVTYYEFPNKDSIKKIYILNFIHEKNRKFREQILLEYKINKFEIAGYNFRD